MKRPKFLIKPYSKTDKKNAKLMQEVIDYNYDRYKPFIDSVLSAQIAFDLINPDAKQYYEVFWDKILEEGIKLDLQNK